MVQPATFNLEPATPSVKVLDFGLAAQIHTSFSRMSQVRYGTSGTGPYMAPEQWRGEYQDGATDQYALAVLAYELIAGHCPFESHETTVLKQAVLDNEPKRPAGLPETSWQALKCGLAKSREERFSSCGDFAAALGGDKEKLRNTLNARKVGRAGSARRVWKAITFLILLAGLAWGGQRGYRVWQERAQARAEQAKRDEAAAQMDAERRTQAEGLRGETEAALARGDLKTAGEKLAELQDIPGAQSLAAGLRARYESAAGAQDVRQRYGKAQIAYDDALKLPDGPGSEDLKKDLREKWIVAEDAKKAEAWGQALSAYDAVVAACEKLVQADGQRQEAESGRKASADAQKAAAGDGAKTNAPQAWAEATAADQTAGVLFEKADFIGALAGWKKAAGLFDTARQRARAVQAYGQAKGDYDGALAQADQALLGQYGGANWQTAREKAAEGATSADQPETGWQAYAEALAALTAALAEVEKKAIPTLTIEATAAGKKVNATVTDGKGGSWTTATPLGLKKGSNYAFSVTYTSDPSGTRWSPAAVKVVADWAGPKTQKVVLAEIKSPVAGQDWPSPATGMKFVWIESLGIWVGQYEVTNGEYEHLDRSHDSGEYEGNSLSGDRQPVVNVNFDDATKFANWLNDQDAAVLDGAKYRLPSETEWQAFAQCGENRLYPWGDEMPPTYGNYYGQEGAGSWSKISGYRDGFPVTCPVEESGPNDWGLFGVGGNVWEMATKDGSPSSFGAWRGASWSFYAPGTLRCGFRGVFGGSRRGSDYGFRLVLSRASP